MSRTRTMFLLVALVLFLCADSAWSADGEAAPAPAAVDSDAGSEEVTSRGDPRAQKAAQRKKKQANDAADAPPAPDANPNAASGATPQGNAATAAQRANRARQGADPADAAPANTAQANARLSALRRPSDGGGTSASDVKAPGAPPRRRQPRKTYDTADAAAADASDGYKNIYKTLKARKDFEVEMVDDDSGTGGSYDAAAKKIRLRKKDITADEVVDTLLFESFNAANRKSFQDNATAMRLNRINPTQFGEAQADIELDTVARYVKAIKKMTDDDPSVEDSLTPRALAARKAMRDFMTDAQIDEYPDMKDAAGKAALERFKKFNRESPHDPNGVGRVTLSTAELYKFEHVDRMTVGGVMGMLNKAIGKTTAVERGDLRKKVAQNSRNLAGAAAYAQSVDDASAQFPQANLSGYQLSAAARRIALEENAAKPSQ